MDSMSVLYSLLRIAVYYRAALIASDLGIDTRMAEGEVDQLMISNDRILGNTSTMLLVHKQDTSLLG